MGARKPPLRPEQYERFRRQLLLPELGVDGQLRLLDARVLVVGVGGLGCPAAQTLAAAGVGTLGLVDDDRVEASNLHRQILYGSADVGRPKVEVARERLQQLAPELRVEAHAVRLGADNVEALLDGWDLVVDGSDNFPTRYVLNDACVRRGVVNVHGAVLRFHGQVTVLCAPGGPCYRCLHPEPPEPGSVPSCAEAGVIGVVPALVGQLQANEALKWIAGLGEPLVGRLVTVDALGTRFAEFALAQDPACPACGAGPGREAPRAAAEACEGRAAGPVPEIAAAEVAARLERGEDLLLLDVRNADEWACARVPGARHLPVAELERRQAELLDWKERPVVVLCHHGARSARAARWLLERGFADVRSVTGGIEAWSLTVDPDVPRY